MNLNGKCVFPGQFDTYSSITIDTDLATIDPRNDSYPGSSSLFKQSSFHSACASVCVYVCVDIISWKRVTCPFHGIKEQLNESNKRVRLAHLRQTILILFNYQYKCPVATGLGDMGVPRNKSLLLIRIHVGQFHFRRGFASSLGILVQQGVKHFRLSV